MVIRKKGYSVGCITAICRGKYVELEYKKFEFDEFECEELSSY